MQNNLFCILFRKFKKILNLVLIKKTTQNLILQVIFLRKYERKAYPKI